MQLHHESHDVDADEPFAHQAPIRERSQEAHLVVAVVIAVINAHERPLRLSEEVNPAAKLQELLFTLYHNRFHVTNLLQRKKQAGTSGKAGPNRTRLFRPRLACRFSRLQRMRGMRCA